ncbi:MAG: hypothetical protein EXR98_05130 [Gemmataceae bacterium]|nr:hypothetical protein [Gemmataceae bacterium]
MRCLFGALFGVLAIVAMSAEPVGAGSVEVKGPHICCGACVKAVGKILEKVDGVSGAMADAKTKTVTFTAKDEAAAKAGVKAIFEGGFYGKATDDGKELKVAVGGVKKGDKVESVTVKNVHACCGLCHKEIKGLFADSKVSFEGTGAQRTVLIEGGNLEASAVLQALRKAGFNGTIQK